MGCQKSYLGSKMEAFSPKNGPKGGPGAKKAFFPAKMLKCSKPCVLRVEMALRTIRNRTKSLKEGKKISKNQKNMLGKKRAKKNTQKTAQKAPKNERRVLGRSLDAGPAGCVVPAEGGGETSSRRVTALEFSAKVCMRSI